MSRPSILLASLLIVGSSNTAIAQQPLRILSGAAGAFAGSRVTTINFDNNGLLDLVVGEPGRNRVKIYRSGGVALPWPPTTFDGPSGSIGYGSAICSTGTIDTSAEDDLLVGSTSGHVDVYFFGPLGAGLVSTITGSAVDGFGRSVAIIPDQNGDNFNDLLIGAPFENGGTGVARIYSGRIHQRVLRTIAGTAPGEGFSTAVARLGDFNGDMVDEFAISAPGPRIAGSSGTVYVYDGSSGAFLANLPTQSSLDQFGAALATGIYGVENAILVGANAKASPGMPATSDAGEVRAFTYAPGPSGPWVEIPTSPIAGDVRPFGMSGDACGSSLAGNDNDVVLIGSPQQSIYAPEAGAATVFQLSTGAVLHRFVGRNAMDRAGASVALGDVTGDGIDDYIIGIPGDDSGGLDGGAVYVYPGGEALLSASHHQLPFGGRINLNLSVGASNYLALVLGTLGSTRPGLAIRPDLVIPLNPDTYFGALASLPPVSILGPATFTQPLPSPSLPAATGLQLHHAYLLIDLATGQWSISNAVPTNLVR